MSANSPRKAYKISPTPTVSGRAVRPGTRHDKVMNLLAEAGWEENQIARHYPLRQAAGTPAEKRVHHHGPRDDRVAYVLCPKPGVPALAVATVGAQHDPRKALARAIRQAQRLDAPLAVGANGEEMVQHFMASGRTTATTAFPSPPDVWRTYVRFHDLRAAGAHLLAQPFDQASLAAAGTDVKVGPAWPLRYFELVGANRALAAYCGRRGGALLRIAAGAGATVTASTVISKLVTFSLLHRPGEALGVLYLDDRPEALTGLGPLGTTLRWGERGEVWAKLGRLRDEVDLDTPDQVDLLVLNMVHGDPEVLEPDWLRALARHRRAFKLAMVDVANSAARDVYQEFGNPALYGYGPTQARADGYL
jgi:hypothetical protein